MSEKTGKQGWRSLEDCRIEHGPPRGVLYVCPTCGGLYQDLEEEGRSPPQRCRCRADADDWRVWRGYDFNEQVCLCRCCARVPLSSGRRFASWFCSECADLMRAAEASLGRRAVPIGRHSVMNGGVCRHPGLEGGTPVEALLGTDAESFVQGLGTLFGGIGRLEVWQAVWTGRLFAAALPTAERATLRQYLNAVDRLEDARFERERAVEGLLAHLGVVRNASGTWQWSQQPPPAVPPALPPAKRRAS